MESEAHQEARDLERGCRDDTLADDAPPIPAFVTPKREHHHSTEASTCSTSSSSILSVSWSDKLCHEKKDQGAAVVGGFSPPTVISNCSIDDDSEEVEPRSKTTEGFREATSQALMSVPHNTSSPNADDVVGETSSPSSISPEFAPPPPPLLASPSRRNARKEVERYRAPLPLQVSPRVPRTLPTKKPRKNDVCLLEEEELAPPPPSLRSSPTTTLTKNSSLETQEMRGTPAPAQQASQRTPRTPPRAPRTHSPSKKPIKTKHVSTKNNSTSVKRMVVDVDAFIDDDDDTEEEITRAPQGDGVTLMRREDETTPSSPRAAMPRVVKVPPAGVSSPPRTPERCPPRLASILRNSPTTTTTAAAASARRRDEDVPPPPPLTEAWQSASQKGNAKVGDDDDDDDMRKMRKRDSADIRSPSLPPRTPGSSPRVASILRSSPTTAAAAYARRRDEKVPLPPVAVRSASQEAAVNAVLAGNNDDGNNDDLIIQKKRCYSADVTAELTDDELTAVIAPQLRRHGSSSTPGAFPAGGGSCGSGVVPLDSLAPRVSSGSVGSALTPSYTQNGDASIDDSCTTLVSATLVTTRDNFSDSEYCHSYNFDGRRPVLAHAEPLRKKWRIVLCLSLWTILAVGAIAVSVSLALTFTGVIGDWKKDEELPGDTSRPHGSADPEDGYELVNVTSSPTRAPITTVLPTAPPMGYVSGTRISYHAVSWGKISTCGDSNFFLDYNMGLRCGGALELKHVENAECLPVLQAGTANVTDPSRMSCQLMRPDMVLTKNGDYYQEAVATAIFSCTGTSNQDRVATVSLPKMQVANCTGGNGRRRRLKNIARPLQPEATRVRAVQEAVSSGGASAFVSMGRFCRDESEDWVLWHQLYPCEFGKRFMITALGKVWEGDPSNMVAAQGSSEENGDSGSKSSGGFFGYLDGVLGGGGRRGLQFLDGVVDAVWEAADVRSYCYDISSNNNSDACTGVGGNCNFTVLPISMSDSDPRATCKSRLDDVPSLDFMQEAVQDAFKPSMFIDHFAIDL